VSTSAVRLLVQARHGCEEAFVEAEEVLVEAARSLPVEGLRQATASRRQSADPAVAAEDEERRFERRALHVSATLDGMGRIDGDVTGSRDARTALQRRAEALVEICRSFLDRADRPVVGGERPHVVVLMPLETLERWAPGRCELAGVGPITPEAARRLACDANVSRVITDARSVPLEPGRRTRVVPAALRRALVVRDRTCAFPGCDRPPSWCDAHHIRHWADGGETALENLVLLCRRHHRIVHHGRFHIEMRDALPVFFRRDGTELVSRAPP
jgi:hypothetical protein